MQTGEVSGLLQKLGITATQIASGPLKGQPDPTAPLNPQARDYLQGLIGDLYDQFVVIVAEGRHMDAGRVRALADGRAYTGRQALPLGLIDQYGGEREARAWLAGARHVPLGVPVVDIDRKGWLARHGVSTGAASLFGGVINSVLPPTLDGRSPSGSLNPSRHPVI